MMVNKWLNHIYGWWYTYEWLYMVTIYGISTFIIIYQPLYGLYHQPVNIY